MGLDEDMVEMRRRMNKPSEKPIWQDEIGKKYLSATGEEKNKDLSPLVSSLSTRVAESRANDASLDDATRESASSYLNLKKESPEMIEAKKRALASLAVKSAPKKGIVSTIRNSNLMGNLDEAMKKKAK
jgi:hypothetical protein